MSLADHLARHAGPAIRETVEGLAVAAAALDAHLGSAMPPSDGARDVFEAALAGLPLRFASLRGGGIRQPDPAGNLALALDPFDGTGGDSGGTMFALWPADGDAAASLLRPGTEQVASGCIRYGPSTLLALALDGAPALFALDRTCGQFQCRTAELRIPGDGLTIAMDAGAYRHWDRPAQRFLDECLARSDDPDGADHRLIWSGSLAAGFMEILLSGGLCLAPRGGRGIDLLHQAHAAARLAEAAGGAATDGARRALSREPAAFDATGPLALGSPHAVARFAACHELPDSQTWPLFGQRGLFRS